MFSEIVDSISKYHATFGCFYTIVQLSLELLANSLIIPMTFLLYLVIRGIWNDHLRHYKSFDSLDWFAFCFIFSICLFLFIAAILGDRLLLNALMLILILGFILILLIAKRLKYKEKRK